MTDKHINFNPRVVLSRLKYCNTEIVQRESSENISHSSSPSISFSTLAENSSSMAEKSPSKEHEQPAEQIERSVAIKSEADQSDITFINFNIAGVVDLMDDSNAAISNSEAGNNRNVIMLLLNFSGSNPPTVNVSSLSENESTMSESTDEAVDSKENVLVESTDQLVIKNLIY